MNREDSSYIEISVSSSEDEDYLVCEDESIIEEVVIDDEKAVEDLPLMEVVFDKEEEEKAVVKDLPPSANPPPVYEDMAVLEARHRVKWDEVIKELRQLGFLTEEGDRDFDNEEEDEEGDKIELAEETEIDLTTKEKEEEEEEVEMEESWELKVDRNNFDKMVSGLSMPSVFQEIDDGGGGQGQGQGRRGGKRMKRLSNIMDVGQASTVRIIVTIYAGRNLVAMDKSFFGKQGKSDPFVKIFVGNDNQSDVEQFGTSTVKYDTLAPVWGEQFLIEIGGIKFSSPLLDNVVLRIKDYDRLSHNDPMGTVTIPITQQRKQKTLKLHMDRDTDEITPELVVKDWIPVGKGVGKHYNRKAKGELHVGIEIQ